MNESNLHQYQKACVQHIIEHPYCGVFLDMGLGKTVSTLTAINSLMYDSFTVRRVLVIAPKRVADTVWEEETTKWEHLSHLKCSKVVGDPAKRIMALRQSADIYIISRDNVEWLVKLFHNNFPFDMVVVDELSSFKSSKSHRWKALKRIRPYISRFVGLTGTPAPNGLIDLWPQIYLMDEGARLGRTLTTYRNRYFTPAGTNGYIVYKYKLLPGADDIIHEQIKDICISMKASDYLTMPPRTDNFIELVMPQELKQKYKDFERDSVMEIVNEVGDTQLLSVANAAGLCNKLLQFANGCIYNEDDQGEKSVTNIHDLKINALREIVDTANGQPVLVAYTYQFDRDNILDKFADYKPRLLYNANDIKEWNEGKIPLMLAHPASAGHGLNLQRGGSIIVWYGLTWSLELYQQFNGRLYRQGQQNPVVINHLVMKGTYDERVVKTLRSKDITQNSLMENIKAVIDGYIK